LSFAAGKKGGPAARQPPEALLPPKILNRVLAGDPRSATAECSLPAAGSGVAGILRFQKDSCTGRERFSDETAIHSQTGELAQKFRRSGTFRKVSGCH